MFKKLGKHGVYPTKFSALLDKIVSHLTKFSAFLDKIVIHLIKFLTLSDQIVTPPPKKKVLVLWKTLNFKKASSCEVDPRCSFDFVQCVHNNGVKKFIARINNI